MKRCKFIGIILFLFLTLLPKTAWSANGKIIFGEYPQTLINRDSELFKTLKNFGLLDGETVYLNGEKYIYHNVDFYKYEPISWLIISGGSAKTLLISEYVLDNHSYGTVNDMSVPWEKSDLRKWCNTEFINTAFTNYEQACIYSDTVNSCDGSTKKIVTTTEKISIPSHEMVNTLPASAKQGRGTDFSGKGNHDYYTRCLKSYLGVWDYPFWVTTTCKFNTNYPANWTRGIRPCILVDTGKVKIAEEQRKKEKEQEIKKEKPAYPTSAKVTAKLSSYNKATVSWEAITGAQQYTVQIKVGNSGKWKTYKTLSSSKTSVTIGLKSGTVYKFRVKGIFKDNISGTYKTSNSLTTLRKQTKPKITATSNSITIKWTKDNGATGYQIMVSKNQTSSSQLLSTIKNKNTVSYTFCPVSNQKISYKIRSYKNEGKKTIYGPWSSATQYTFKGNENKFTNPFVHDSGPIQGVQAILGGGVNNIKVTWKSSDWAASYKVFLRASKNGKPLQTETVSATQNNEVTLNGSNLKSNKKYYISVVAVSWDDKEGQESNNVTITTLPSTKLLEIKKETNSSVSAKWEEKARVTGYQLMVTEAKDKKDKSSISIEKGKDNNTDNTVIPVQAGKPLYFYVRVFTRKNNITTYGNWSSPKAFTLPACNNINLGSSDNQTRHFVVKFNSIDNTTASFNAEYTDNFFNTPANASKEDQPSLALLSCLGAASTYGNFERDFIDKIGFDGFDEWKYNSSTLDCDHGRVCLGHKLLDNNQTLVVIAVISGYNDNGYEWISNFNLGLGSDHEGFRKASDEIKGVIKKYVDDKKAKNTGIKTVKYWLMGHSRGGAITNLIAHDLSSETGKKNVYAYGFATPNCTTNDGVSLDNIKNYLIPEDFVTLVAPQRWGYQRYGKDIPLDKNIKKRKVCFSSLTGKKYVGFSMEDSNDLYKAFCNLGGSNKYSYKFNIIPSLLGIPLPSIIRPEVSITAEIYAKWGLAAFLTDDKITEGMGLAFILDASLTNADASIVTAKMCKDQDKFKNTHCIGNYVASIAAYYGL